MRPIELVVSGTVPGIPARIWPLVSEPDQLALWFEPAERIEVLEGDGEGRRQRVHSRRLDEQMETDQLVTDFEPPRRIAWREEGARLKGEPVERYASESRFAIELRAEGERTMVTLRGTQVPTNFFRGVLIRWFGNSAGRRSMQTSVAALAELVEELDAARTGAPEPDSP